MNGKIGSACLLGLALLSGPAMAGGMLTPFEPDSLPRIVEQHKGKPFMLFIWSLDCVYCQASLDTMSAAQTGKKPLTIVTLSTDAADDAQAVAAMEKRLRGLRMTRNAWAFGSASPEKLKYALDPKWHGEKPRSYWYNARGERIAYSGVLTRDLIEKLHAQVLK